MSNPFAQGDDPFGELPLNQPLTAALKPARRPPPRPAAANPFSTHAASTSGPPPGQTAAANANDPFDWLAAAAPPASSTISSNQQQGRVPQQQPPEDDIFGLFSSATPAAATAKAATATSSSSKDLPPPPSYSTAAGLPPPPAYDAAISLPPAYDAAVQMPAAPSFGHDRTEPRPGATGDAALTGLQHKQQQAPAAFSPVRAAPPAPAAAVGPLTAARPSRPAPAPPGAALSPARAAPSAPGGHAAAAAAAVTAPVPARAAPAPPAAALGASAAHQLSATALTGNVGHPPKSSVLGGQQVQSQELGANIRLPPLNPKAAAPLKLLTAGLGALFAGPVDEASLLLQWCPRESGNTLPARAAAFPREDHDSAAAAVLTCGGAAGGSAKDRISSLLFAPGPGWLWAGATNGKVHCWAVHADGSAARWLHSCVAHNGKVKGLAVSPCGRLFTGSSSGSIKMWSYGSPAFGDASAPRMLRQLKKVDVSSGVASNPHSKVVAMAVSAGGRVLWSVGKGTVSLWSTHNGDFLGSISESGALGSPSDPFSSAAAGQAAYGSAYSPQLRSSGVGAALDINPMHGLRLSDLDSLFEMPTAETRSDMDAFDSEKDAASVAYNAAVKGAAKASKLIGKLTKMAVKAKEEGKSGDNTAPEQGLGGMPSGGCSGGYSNASTVDPGAGLEAKVAAWGSIKKLAAAIDGSMWLSYKDGLLEKYSEGGKLLWTSSNAAGAQHFQQQQQQQLGGSYNSYQRPVAGSGGGGAAFRPSGGITALAAVGSSIWVGDQEGRIWVLDGATGALQRSWKAHVFPVRSIAAGGHLVYSLGKAGSIRAWPAVVPPMELTAAWRADTADCLQQQQLQVLVGTWNVNETKPSRAGLERWLGSCAKQAQVVMIGLQEVEMGTGSVALDVVYQNLAKSRLEAGTQAAQAWAAAIGDVLASKGAWKRIALRQMSGVLVLVFARAELEPHIGEVATASVACGVMGYGGNKGAVAVSFSLFRRRMVVVSSHLAAHQDKVEARNADYAKIVRHLHFHNVPTDKPQQQQQYESADVVVSSSETDTAPGSHQHKQLSQTSSAETGPGGSAAWSEGDWGAGMKDAELLVWVGDFNYRVDAPDGFLPNRSDPETPVNEQLYRFVLQKIAARQHVDLLSGDQCSREMARGNIFHGLAEGPIRFLPTYKFEKGRESSIMQPFYDQGEKMRVPAWTDRIFFRGSAAQLAALSPNPLKAPADVRVCLAGVEAYSSVLEVNDSDHKPVYALLQLELPWYQQQHLRSASLQRLWQVASISSSSSAGPLKLGVEQQQLMLASSHIPSFVRLTNPTSTPALFMVSCKSSVGHKKGVGLPTWLEVVPAVGTIPPGQSVQLRVQGSKAAAWGGPGGSLSCELQVLGCGEGSVDSSLWPQAGANVATNVFVVLA